MFVVIVLGIFAVLIAATEKIFLFKHGLKFSFILIFLFTALRYNYGTDYFGYYKDFIDVGMYPGIFSINFDMFQTEKAWCILTYLLQPIGYFGFIILLSAFLCYTYYSLIKKYVEPQFYWFAVFVYVFSCDVMWIQLSALRQAFATALFVNSIQYLDDKKNPIKYILINIFAGLFHTSAFITLPFVFFAIESLKRTKFIGIVIFASFWSVLLWGKDLVPSMRWFSEFFLGERYLSRFDLEVDSSTTLIGSIAWGLLLLTVLYYAIYHKEDKKYLFYLCSIYFLMYVLNPLFFLSSRIGFFFAPFSIIVYPLIIQKEDNILIKCLVCILFSVSIVYRLSVFLTLDWVIQGYEKYQTIFSSL